MARSTWDGSSVPEEHADPVETATPFEVERDEQRLGLDTVEADVGRVGHPPGRVAVDDGARHAGQDPGFETVPQARDVARSVLELRPGDAGGGAQPRDGRHVLGTRPATPLLPAAGRGRDQPPAAPHPERAGALRPVELVGRQRQQIDAETLHVDRDLADRLHGVRVEQRALRMRDRRQLRNRLDRADLVVGMHDRDEGGLGARAPPRASPAIRCRGRPPGAASWSNPAGRAPSGC